MTDFELSDAVALLNHVANHPDVLRHIAPGRSFVNCARFFDNPENMMFGDEDGLILFFVQPDNTYKMHWLLTEAARGPAAIRLARHAFLVLFTQTNCYAIKGSTPRENLAARQMNRAIGGVPTGASIDDSGRPCIEYTLERRKWATSFKTSSEAPRNSHSPTAITRLTEH